MKTWKEMTIEEAMNLFEHVEAVKLRDRHDNGKTIVLYENNDFGHPELGHRVAWVLGPDTPLPPVDHSCPWELSEGRMNWRYYPKGVVRP